MKTFNILSLFDGMSCCQIALKEMGITNYTYYASELDKYAIKTTQHNFPNTIQLGDVQKVKATDLPKIDLLIGGSPCFVAGTKILTTLGYKNIEDVRVGDKVLSHTGNWRQVLRTGLKENIETRIIKGQGNIGLETTDEHPFYTKNKKNFSGKPEWIEAKNLTNDYYCAIREIVNRNFSIPDSVLNPYDFCFTASIERKKNFFR